MNKKDFKLCFVKSNEEMHILYFSPYDAMNVTGDDWDDAPYEHNASIPYGAKLKSGEYVGLEEGNGNLIKVIAFVDSEEGDWFSSIELKSPCSNILNSDYSVDEINRGKVPWLKAEHYSQGVRYEIYANETYGNVLEKLNGLIYLKDKSVRKLPNSNLPRKYKIKMNIKELIEEHGLTQKQVANMAGIRENTISELIREDRKGIHFETLEKFAAVLGIEDMNELISFQEDVK